MAERNSDKWSFGNLMNGTSSLDFLSKDMLVGRKNLFAMTLYFSLRISPWDAVDLVKQDRIISDYIPFLIDFVSRICSSRTVPNIRYDLLNKNICLVIQNLSIIS